MNKKPRRINISAERAAKINAKEQYSEVYVFDPDFLEEYKNIIINASKDNPELQERMRINMSSISEFIIADRVKNGLGRLVCTKDSIHMDIQFADITNDSFSIRPGHEYIETIFVHELLHAAARRKIGLTGIADYLRDENGKVVGRKNDGLNEGITQFLTEQITGKTVPDEIDSYPFNKKIVSLLDDILGPGIMHESYFGDPNLLKNAMNLAANNPNYYEEFNRDLDTINKLQTAIRKIKNGSITPKDPDSLVRMEKVLEVQQQKLVESVFINIVIPQIQKIEVPPIHNQENREEIAAHDMALSKRQNTLLPLLLKHESLLKNISKYVAKHGHSNWVSDNILNSIKKEIKETGIDFSKIIDASKAIIPTQKFGPVTAKRYVSSVDDFYNENQALLEKDSSTTMTPLLKRELESMVTILEQLELVAEQAKLDSAKTSLEEYKVFLKKHFHKIPNLEEEIDKIKQQRKKSNNSPELEPEEVRLAKEAGKKKAEEILTRQEENKNTSPKEEKQTKGNSILEENFIVDNITGQVFSQKGKTIYQKAVTIANATGEAVDLEDSVLVKLREDAIQVYRTKLDKQEPDPILISRYGDNWKEVLIDAYTKGWNMGISSVISKATKEGLNERKDTIEAIKKNKLPKENINEPITLEEIEAVNRAIEIKTTPDSKEEIINKESGNLVLSERTKKIAKFAKEWERVNGEDAFGLINEEKYQVIQNIIASNENIDLATVTNQPELADDIKTTLKALYSNDETRNIAQTFFAMQQLTPSKLQEIETSKLEQQTNNVTSNLDSASLEEVNNVLNSFNGKPILQEDGSAYHPFNDPLVAAKLNQRYLTLTGQDHPRFVEQAPIVINEMLKDKDVYLSSDVYKPEYFDNLEIIRSDLETRHPEIIQVTNPEKSSTK